MLHYQVYAFLVLDDCDQLNYVRVHYSAQNVYLVLYVRFSLFVVQFGPLIRFDDDSSSILPIDCAVDLSKGTLSHLVSQIKVIQLPNASIGLGEFEVSLLVDILRLSLELRKAWKQIAVSFSFFRRRQFPYVPLVAGCSLGR